MGESHTKGLGYMADAANPAALIDGYKEARIAILHQGEVEKGVINSAGVLWTDANHGKQTTTAFVPMIDQRVADLLNEVKVAYQLQAAERGVRASEPAMTDQEREAANLIVESVGGAGRGGRGGGGGRGAAPTGPQLPEEMNAEFTVLLGKHKTALEIRDFLSGEFTPLPLADLMAVLHARAAGGTVKLTEKTGK
jgi:aminopeptidase YwaD